MLIKTEIIGNLVRDAIVREMPNTNPPRQALSFTVAADAAQWTDKQGVRQKKTEYADCVIYGQAGAFDGLMSYKMLSKGHTIRVEGAPDTSREPTQAANGKWYNSISYTIERNSLKFLNTPHAIKKDGQQAPVKQAPVQQAPAQQPVQQSNAQQPNAQQSYQAPQTAPDFDDDIPF